MKNRKTPAWKIYFDKQGIRTTQQIIKAFGSYKSFCLPEQDILAKMMGAKMQYY